MGEFGNSHLLSQVILKLSPDVFFHPLWVHFYPKTAAASTEIIERLVLPIQALLEVGDHRSASQLLLGRSALQKRFGNPLSAIRVIQKVWNIGLAQKMPEVENWADWGGCSISYGMREFSRAAEYLERLQGRLDKGEDWVIASTLEIIKNTLLDEPINAGSINEIFSWMQGWGEPFYAASLLAAYNASPAHPTHQALPRFSMAWWSALIQIMRKYISGEQPVWITTNDHTAPNIESYNLDTFRPPSHATGVNIERLAESNLTSGGVEPAEQDPGDRLLLEMTSKELLQPESRNQLSLRFYCLGDFLLYQNGQWIYRWVSRKALSVLKYLVVYHPTPVSKDALMDSLWPDADAESARRNLHQAIYTLRHTLKGEAPDFQHILFEKEHYSLNPQMELWMDFVEFERHYHTGQDMERLGHYYEAIQAYEAAELLYRGDFMGEDLYEDMPVARRQYFWEMYLSNIYRLTRCYLELGQVKAAIVANQKILERDKTQEPAHQNLIKCYIDQGQRNLAIRQYQICVKVLMDELGVPPSADTRAIYQKIIQM